MARKLKNWLKGYYEYTEQTESPDQFHMWVGLSVLSAATQRNIYIDRSYFCIYPNLYVLLVGPPGVRKSSAMSYGKSLLQKLPGINIEANKLSPQALIQSLNAAPTAGTIVPPKSPGNAPSAVLKRTCAGVIYSSEFSVTLGSDAHQNGLLALLTDLFDSPDTWDYKTISRGPETLTNVYLTILGATTPDWLSTSIPSDAIGGGFTSRIIFVYQDNRRKNNAYPKMTPALIKLRDDLIHDLEEVSKVSGNMHLTKEAEQFYEEWYNAQDGKAMDERFWAYLERKPIHLLKLAMLISLSFSNDGRVTVAHIEMGIALLARVERRMPEAFRNVGNTLATDLERILEQFISAPQGKISWQQLVQRNLKHISIVNIELVVKALIESGTVSSISVGTGTKMVRLLSLNDTTLLKK